MSPRLLRLRLPALARRDGILLLVRRLLAPAGADEARTVHAYEFKCDERAFARRLLERAPQWWAWRCHQQAYCGDFVLVDLSAPSPAARSAVVVELKRGAAVRVGGGGLQVRNAGLATDELVAQGLLARGCGWSALAGDAGAVLAFLGAR